MASWSASASQIRAGEGRHFPTRDAHQPCWQLLGGLLSDPGTGAVANSHGSQLGRGIEDGTNDFVVAGAPAEIAGEPVACLVLRRVRIAV
jgi:hypothetical protein